MIRLFCQRLLPAAAMAVGLVWGVAANATTISIGYSESDSSTPTLGSGITTMGTSSGTSLAETGSAGNFSTIEATVNETTAPGGGFLDSYSFDTTSGGAGNLFLYVTLSGISGQNSATFTPTFTVNSSSTGASYQISGVAYYDGANAVYGLGTSLGSTTAPSTTPNDPNSAFSPTSTSLNTADPFSLTEVFEISMGGSGTTNSTFDIQYATSNTSLTTPLPAALPLFGSVIGCGAVFGKWRKRRKIKATEASAAA
jgi:hypothetical protein